MPTYKIWGTSLGDPLVGKGGEDPVQLSQQGYHREVITAKLSLWMP
jgi:hypothetical protein